jgi:hypothetical protein
LAIGHRRADAGINLLVDVFFISDRSSKTYTFRRDVHFTIRFLIAVATRPLSLFLHITDVAILNRGR